MRLAAIAILISLGLGCDDGAPPAREPSDASTRDDAAAGRDAAGAIDSAVPADTGGPGSDAGSIAPRDCVYAATDFAAAPQELDVAPGSAERLGFEIPGLPDPAALDSAFLLFESWDADHPGEEGVIQINGVGAIDLPAMTLWDNAPGSGRIDVRALLVAGRNEVSFGPGPLDRSFFRISRVQIEARARVETCLPPPVGPPPDAVRRALHFHEAVYGTRATWVVPCPPGHPRFAAIRDYAFTASGAEHVDTDCDGLYVPGSGERGTATFTFDAVVAATYAIEIRFRTSANRNPAGALFVVNGEERRIDQVDASGEYRDVVWGERSLSGTVVVVLDSSREAESDSVTEVRLIPTAGP